MSSIEAFQIAATTHGHYLVEGGAGEQRPLLVGFHGYAETAAVHLDALRALPLQSPWRRCAIQGLHTFYERRTGEVRASWMTRFNRELAIADNVAYVAAVVERVERDFGSARPLAWLGFSQGVAMAYRAAARSGRAAQALVALGGDLPPDLGDAELERLPPLLIGRGSEDPWYSEEKLAADLGRLEARRVPVEVCRFQGGHEWSPEFLARAGSFLDALAAG